jgi:ribosomal protein S18 acetylase RimI-like enzyme
MIGTHPSYRRKGVASMLMDWGVQQADRDGLRCFVDASDQGVPLYKKYGFVGQEPFTIPGEGFTCTSFVRPVMTK